MAAISSGNSTAHSIERPSALGQTKITSTGETVLVVEDEPAIRLIDRRILEKAGYVVLDAGDGAAALDLCERHSGPIHILITDIMMPRMNGWDLAKEFAAKRPDTKVLYVSGYTNADSPQLLLLEKEVSFLHKPFGPDLLTRAVRSVLDKTSDS